jgi:hypothetical protein
MAAPGAVEALRAAAAEVEETAAVEAAQARTGR